MLTNNNAVTNQLEGDAYPCLQQVVAYLDETLQCPQFSGIDAAVNGLQVGNLQQPLRKVVAAVDASIESFQRAVDLKADLLLVHHGIFWKGQPSPVIGPSYERLALLIRSNLALYAAHLPLDSHLLFGNNIDLAERLKLQDIQPFANYKGLNIGCAGNLPKAISIEAIRQLLNAPETTLQLPFSRKSSAALVQKIAIVSGAGAIAIEEATQQGCDLLLTGEIAHQHYHLAKELGLSILAIGHYRSEMGGVQRLIGLLTKRWPSLTSDFIDFPTGL